MTKADIHFTNKLILHNVDVVSTPEMIKKGLKGVEELESGMLFLLDMDVHTFHMQDCLIPLDIIFLRGDHVTKIHRNVQPCLTSDCESYHGKGNMVLEVNAGFCRLNNISEGFKLNNIVYK